MTTEPGYVEAMSAGAVAALEALAEQVAEHIRHVEDPTSEGPTWLGLEQLIEQALAAARRFPDERAC